MARLSGLAAYRAQQRARAVGAGLVGAFPAVIIAQRAIAASAKFSRVGSARTVTSEGVASTVPANTPRWAQDGSLVMQLADVPNYIRNLTGAGQVSGTSARPTFSDFTAPPGLTAIFDEAVVDGEVYTTLRLFGTTSGTNSVIYAPDTFANGMTIPLAKGDTYTFSNTFRLHAGTWPAASAASLGLTEIPAPAGAGNTRADGAVPPQGGTAPSATVQMTTIGTLFPMQVSKTLIAAAPTALNPRFNMTLAAGIAVDFTLSWRRGGWRLSRQRDVTTPLVDVLNGQEAVDVTGYAPHGTLFLDLAIQQRHSGYRPVVRLGDDSDCIELAIVPESYMLVGRRISGGAVTGRTPRSRNLGRNVTGRAFLRWETVTGGTLLSVGANGGPFTSTLVPALVFSRLRLLGFGGTVTNAVLRSTAGTDTQVRAASVLGASIADALTPRNGNADGGAGVWISNDPNRSPIHYAVPSQKMNDPNGTFWHPQTARYRQYAQHIPVGIVKSDGAAIQEDVAVWHGRSGTDLMHWQDRGIALRPAMGAGPDVSGDITGSAWPNADGTVEFYLTAVPGGDLRGISTDGGDTIALDYNPLLTVATATALSGAAVSQGRDPDVFEAGGTRWYLWGCNVTGSGWEIQLYKLVGGALQFVSRLWRQGAAGAIPTPGNTTLVAECPTMRIDPISGRAVLIYSIPGDSAYYVVGDFNAASGAFAALTQGRVAGPADYAGKMFYDADGRIAYMAWVKELVGSGDDNYSKGYDGSLGLPMRVAVDGSNRLLMQPHPDVDAIRQAARAFAPVNGATLSFATQAADVVLSGTGDLNCVFLDAAAAVGQVAVNRAAATLTVSGTSLPTAFDAQEVVTLRVIRGGNIFHAIATGATSGTQVRITTRGPLSAGGACTVALPAGASLVSAVGYDLTPTSTDRMAS